jgi:hypothetical protein
MKLTKLFVCFLLVAGLFVVPTGCGPGEAEKIDASQYEEESGEGEEDYDDGRGENPATGGGGEGDYTG